jgi:hypothetical protein
MHTGQNSKHSGPKNCGISSKGKTELSSIRLPIDPGPGPPSIGDPSVNQTCPLKMGGVPVPGV